VSGTKAVPGQELLLFVASIAHCDTAYSRCTTLGIAVEGLLRRSEFTGGERFESIAPQMKVSSGRVCAVAMAAKAKIPNQEKSQSHFVSSFCFYIFLLQRQQYPGIRSVHFPGQGINDVGAIQNHKERDRSVRD
jgi:hypothetical protein